tara:strand:- start:7673 stop:8362 length:690 start_codon:yes stop_codon:yes gene_type:complete
MTLNTFIPIIPIIKSSMLLTLVFCINGFKYQYLLANNMTNQKVKPYRCNANDKQYKTARKLAGHDGALVCFSCSNSECLTHSWCAGGPRGTVTDGEYVAENHERSHLAEVDELITISSIHGSVRHSCKTCVHHQAIHTTHWFNSRPNATDTVTLINTGEYEVTERKFIHINPQGVAFMHTESQFIRDGKVLCSHSGEGSPARQWIRQIQQNVQFNTFIASMESANAENQ